MSDWTPTPVPLLPPDEHGRVPGDIGDDARAAIVARLQDDFSHVGGLAPEQAHQLAMLAAASVRALLYELHVMRSMHE